MLKLKLPNVTLLGIDYKDLNNYFKNNPKYSFLLKYIKK